MQPKQPEEKDVRPFSPDLSQHLQHITEERRPAVQKREEADATVRRLNKQLFDALNDAGKQRGQCHNGTVVMIVAPAPRPSISREKLLAAGVDPTIIADCTVATPVDPYVRVDYPKVKTEGADVQAPTTDATAKPGEPANRPVTH